MMISQVSLSPEVHDSVTPSFISHRFHNAHTKQQLSYRIWGGQEEPVASMFDFVPAEVGQLEREIWL